MRKGEDEDSRSHTEENIMRGEDLRPTFAEDGHQDDGLESSTYAITRLFIFLELYR